MEALNELKYTWMISSWPLSLSEKGPLAMCFKIISIIFCRRVANRCSLQAEIKPHTPSRAGKQKGCPKSVGNSKRLVRWNRGDIKEDIKLVNRKTQSNKDPDSERNVGTQFLFPSKCLRKCCKACRRSASGFLTPLNLKPKRVQEIQERKWPLRN